MKNDEDAYREIVRETARESLMESFSVLVHDMSCDCETANPVAASAALTMADWTLREAFDAWYERWLSGGE